MESSSWGPKDGGAHRGYFKEEQGPACRVHDEQDVYCSVRLILHRSVPMLMQDYTRRPQRLRTQRVRKAKIDAGC